MRPDPLVSALVAVLLSAGGWAANALTAGGAAAATVVGFAILDGAGWPGAAVLGAFFILSSAVGRIGAAGGHRVGDAKGERRDAWQVLANGGCAALGAVLARGNPGLALWVVTGSLASAGADTWATAIGARSPDPPRSLLWGDPSRRQQRGHDADSAPQVPSRAPALISAAGATVGPPCRSWRCGVL